jgi:mannose-6-phosphate isomerase-like protein (cupin superfamily)
MKNEIRLRGEKMRNQALIAFAMLLSLPALHRSWAQTGTPAKAPRSISGTATDVTNAEIQAAVQRTSSAAVLDQALRVVNINGEYNVGIGVVHRNKTTGPAASSAVEHSEIAEVYHVISGNGTLVTGGVLENPKATEPDSDVVRVLVGPSTRGDKIQGGVSRELGPGDVVIIPPNTPHWFSEVTSDQIVYLVVRVDPKKVLPAGYKLK